MLLREIIISIDRSLKDPWRFPEYMIGYLGLFSAEVWRWMR